MPGIESWNNGTAWDAYNQSLKEIWVQDNYPSAWNVLNAKQMGAEEAFQLAPTGESAYGYKNYADGATATWYSNYSSTVEYVPDTVSQLNSNAGAGRTQTTWYQSPANTGYSGSGGSFNGSDIKTGSGASFVGFLQNTVVPAIAATGLGIKLGKAIDSTLYKANPDFWDNIGLSTMDPATWDSITIDMSDSGWEGVLKRGFNAIFGINPTTGESQMYIDENAAAYLAMYMDQMELFTQSYDNYEYNGVSVNTMDYGSIPDPAVYGEATYEKIGPYVQNLSVVTSEHSSAPEEYLCVGKNTGSGWYTNYEIKVHNIPYANITVPLMNDTYTVDDDVYNYGYGLCHGSANWTTPYSGGYEWGVQHAATDTRTHTDVQIVEAIAKGNKTHHGAPNGAANQPNATLPDFTGCTTPADYLEALKNQYPDMWQNAIEQDVAQPDGTTNKHKYVPVGTPTSTNEKDTQPVTNPNTTGQSQDNTKTNTNEATNELLGTILQLLIKNFTPTGTPTDTKNPPDTGTGDTPVPVVPTGSASSLFAIYNPTQGELNSFGGWLWSNNFVDQLLKLFNDPMQAIIGLHKIFAPPTLGNRQNIYVGYLDSGVNSNTVSNQYTTVNCGSVRASEQFGNVFDYISTQVRLYLPFIGIVPLDTADVMRGTVSVIYHVDVLSGACLAEVKITRDNRGGTIYQFAGDCAVRYPISSGSYMGMVTGVLSVVGGIGSAIMSGGATLPLAAATVGHGLNSMHADVQHSGSFSGCAGAMGIKKPYLIFSRPQTSLANNFGHYQGYPANQSASVSSMTGYFKMADVHLESVSTATESELSEIESLLLQGVVA